jgi:hypothetical protein
MRPDTVPTSDPPDLTVALVAGLYASAVLVPPALVIARPVLAGPAATYIALLVGVTVVATAVTAAVRRVDGLDVRLGAPRRRFLPALVPPLLLAAGAAVAVWLDWSVPAGVAIPCGAAGLGGLALGGVLAVMSDTRYTKAVLADSETLAELRAPWPDRLQRRAHYLGVGIVLASFLVFVVAGYLGRDLVRLGGQTVMVVGIVLGSWGREYSYRVTAVGIEEQLPVRRHLRRWDAFDGYALRDDALVVYPSAPWRLPLYLARDALDDPDEVADIFDRYLPRRSA